MPQINYPNDQDPWARLAALEAKVAKLETAPALQNASIDGGELIVRDPSSGIVRVELGHLPAKADSAAQWGIRGSAADATTLFDTLGLIGTASLLGSESLAVANAAGSGSGWSTVQTIPGSGINFTLPRTGNILCFSFVETDNIAGASNYVGFYFGIWQSGSLIQRKSAGACQGFTTEPSGFNTGLNVFTGLAGGSYQFRQEFALDASSTGIRFGTSSPPVNCYAIIIQLGG